MSNNIPPQFRDTFNQLSKMAQNRGGGMPGPKGAGTGLAGLILLAGGATLINYSLFNVDGGHRAIKYTRIGGVGKEIYNEGTVLPLDHYNHASF